MSSVLRAFADTARNPTIAQPKRVSLVQRGALVVWFAWEPDLQPPKLEGRVITLDGKGRVEYKIPGMNRQHIVDLTSEFAAGTARVLFHTNTDHIRSRPADRQEMRMTDVSVSRCWQMLTEPVTMWCCGCGAPSTTCALCGSTMSTCCLGSEATHAVDVLGGLNRLEAAVAHCHTETHTVHTLLGELRTRRADALCLFCNRWLDSRRGAGS